MAPVKKRRRGIRFFRRLWLKHLIWGVPFTTALALTILTTFLKVFGVNKTQKIIFACSIILSIIAYSVFFFSLYAMWCSRNNNRLKYSLAVIFFVYAAITIIGGIVLIFEKNKIIKGVQNMINDPQVPDSSKYLIEDLCLCCCTQSCLEKYHERNDCKGTIESFINKLAKGGIFGNVAIAFLLILTAVLIIRDVKQSIEYNANFEEAEDNQQEYQTIE